MQEVGPASRAVFLIVAIEREKDALDPEVLGQIHRKGKHGQIALRQRYVAHPFRGPSEVGTESREIHGLQRCAAVPSQILCCLSFAPGIALAIVDPKGMRWLRMLPEVVQQCGAFDSAGEQQQRRCGRDRHQHGQTIRYLADGRTTFPSSDAGPPWTPGQAAAVR